MKPFFLDDDFLSKYESSVLKIAQRRIVKLLFRSVDPISLSSLLDSAHISIGALATIYLDLENQGYLIRTREGFKLTSSGRHWALKKRKSLFMHKEPVLYKPSHLIKDSISLDLSQNETLPRGYILSKIDVNKL